MVRHCSACHADIPEDGDFCGFCGFKQVAIPDETHARLVAALTEGESIAAPIPLTRRKRSTTSETQAQHEATQIPHASSPPGQAPTATSPSGQGLVLFPPPGSRTPSEVSPLTAQISDIAQRISRPDIDRMQRFPLKVEVGLNSDHNFYAGFVENVSGGGLFVATHQLIPIGETVEVTFTVPGLNRSITSPCEVRWAREYQPTIPEMVPGVGMRFLQLDPEAQAAIELFLRHRDPIFYDDE